MSLCVRTKQFTNKQLLLGKVIDVSCMLIIEFLNQSPKSSQKYYILIEIYSAFKIQRP
jgi:hypothetical protein